MTELEELHNQLDANYTERINIRQKIVAIDVKNYHELVQIKAKLLESIRNNIVGKYFISGSNPYKIIDVIDIDDDDDDYVECMLLSVKDDSIGSHTGFHKITNIEIPFIEFNTAYNKTLEHLTHLTQLNLK